MDLLLQMMHFEVLTFAELAEDPNMTIWCKTDSFCLNQILYLALECMAIFNTMPQGSRMKLTASISIVVSGPFIQGRGSKCRLGNNQLKIIQTDKQIYIAHRNDIKPPRSTILLLSLILLMRRLMSRWAERSVIPLRSTSFVLRYSSKHNGRISSWSKIDLYAQPCGS